jgi:hypothetical protein
MRAVVAWLTVCAHPSFFLVVRGVRVWVTVGCCLKKGRRSTMVAGAGVGRVARRRLDGRWINGVVAAGPQSRS